MWALDDELDQWFEEVRMMRQQKAEGGGDDDPPMVQNALTKGLRRR